MQSSYDRVVLIVLDSVGMGAAPDAAQFGDVGTNTLGHIAEWCHKNKKPFSLPNMERWGLGNLLKLEGVPPHANPVASRAILQEVSPGKDTTTGHWEIAGTPLKKEFPVYSEGFDSKLLETWCQENNLKGWLCNRAGSGTQVMEEFGAEHMRSGKPIVYTSADSVWQIAAHEDTFGLERLYDICRSARIHANKLGLGRVIARPFVGNSPSDFTRTENRRDFSEAPPEPNMLDLIKAKADFVGGVGKIEDIFAHRGLTLSNHTGRNETSQIATVEMMNETKGQRGLIFTNLIDFDQHYGHRRNPSGYADCLMAFDTFLPQIEKAAGERDLILLTADHGNDPTHTGTDHTREYVPLLAWSPSKQFAAQDWGTRKGFHHIARLSLDALGIDFSSIEPLKDTKAL